MSIRWDSESDWENSQDSSGTVGRNGDLKQGYSRERPDLSSDLVGYWPLHDNSATDYSGNGNHGSLNGGVTTGVTGKGGLQAMSFDGSSSIDTGAVFSSLSTITMAAWVFVQDTGTKDTVISNIESSNTGDSDAGGELVTSGDSSPKAVANFGKGGNNGFVSINSSGLGTGWHHLVRTYDGSTGHLYVDGELSGSINFSYDETSQQNLKIAVSTDFASNNLQGKISDARLYDRALSDSEIQTLYEWGSGNYAKTPTQSDGGVAYYPLDGGAEDQWGNNDGVVSNTLPFTQDAIRGKAADFTQSDVHVDTGLSLPETFTASAWIKPNSLPSDAREYLSTRGDLKGFAIRTRNGAKFQPYIYDADASTYKSINSREISANKWYNVVFVVINGDRISLYLNGVHDKSLNIGSRTLGNLLRLGDNAVSSKKGPADGFLDDVRIYNRALTDEEIFEIYRYGTRGRDMRKFLVNH